MARVKMDQTVAWISAVFLTGGIFGGLYAVTRYVKSHDEVMLGDLVQEKLARDARIRAAQRAKAGVAPTKAEMDAAKAQAEAKD